MKRSEINEIMKEALDFFEQQNFRLPPFVQWTPDEWKTKGEEAREIRDNMLGWDITDYGQGDFRKIGLLLITLRNGNQQCPERYPKPYAEKIMIVREEQVTPMHFHFYKMEDIINRGGGNLVIKLYNSTEDGELADTDVRVSMDGVEHVFSAGTEIVLHPGESITMQPGLYHRFWGEKGSGTVMAGEVSQCNDDNNDNRFYDKVGRFPEIEEDETPLYLLCSEYPAFHA